MAQGMGASGIGGFLGTVLGRGNSRPSTPQQQAEPENNAITPRDGGKVKPSIKEISIGISPYGEVVTLPLWERHALICGQSGSGKSWVANRLLGEVFQIPKAQRVVAVVDGKGAVEGAKWSRVADAVAGSIEEADVIFSNVDAEMRRREALVKSDIEHYWDSRIHPSDQIPLVLIYIDELAVLGTPVKEDKDLEAIRKHAMFMLNELLFRARSSAICVIAAVQRPDASLFAGGGGMRNNLQNRLCGRVDTSSSSDVVFGMGMAQAGLDASKLTDHWFIAQIEGKGTFRFKTPGDSKDADLKAVALNPRFYAPEGRGDWLVATPDTPESIAPWWNEDGSLRANYMYDLEEKAADRHRASRPAPSDDYDDYDEGEDYEDDLSSGFYEEDDEEEDYYDYQPQPQRQAPRPAHRPAPRQATWYEPDDDEKDDGDGIPQDEMSVDELADLMDDPSGVYEHFGMPTRQGRQQGGKASMPPSPVAEALDTLGGIEFETFTPEELAQPDPRRGGYPRPQGPQLPKMPRNGRPEQAARPTNTSAPASTNRPAARPSTQAARPAQSSQPSPQVEYRKRAQQQEEELEVRRAASLFEYDEDETKIENDLRAGFEEYDEEVDLGDISLGRDYDPFDEESEQNASARSKRVQKAVEEAKAKASSETTKRREPRRRAKPKADDDDWFSRI